MLLCRRKRSYSKAGSFDSRYHGTYKISMKVKKQVVPFINLAKDQTGYDFILLPALYLA